MAAMFLQLNAFDAAAVALAMLAIVAIILSRRRRQSLPPGPRGVPIFGNMLDMPRTHEWLTFAEWKKTFGDLVYLEILGRPMVVINSGKHALALLDKRSAIYSDRPRSKIGDHIGYTERFVLSPYEGTRFHEIRRMFAQIIGSNQSMARFISLVEAEEGRMVLRFWRDPEHGSVTPEKHIRQGIATISLQIAYGYKPKATADPFLRLSEVAAGDFGEVTAPSAFVAESMFPFLLRIPKWMPSFGWNDKFTLWRDNYERLADIPLQWTKKQMAEGAARPSFVALNLEDGSSAEHEHTVKHAGAAFYAGASDTTLSAIESFFLAMMLHPDVQKKAQAELDAVIGRDRLPVFADRANLPYIEALYKEVLRWNPATPLAGPHRLLQDDAYEGYAFRAGTLFLPNVWKFLHDPETYADPFAFNPERFLKSDTNEPEPDPSWAFGFGRRVCPGQLLGGSTVYMACVLSLAAFRISPGKGAPPIRLEDIQYTTGTVSHPPPFKVALVPRDKEAEALLEALEMTLHGE